MLPATVGKILLFSLLFGLGPEFYSSFIHTLTFISAYSRFSSLSVADR
jgi:hypothetical protein